jgi:hypothetical protein
VSTKLSKTIEIHDDLWVVLKLLCVNGWANVVMLMVHFFAIFFIVNMLKTRFLHCCFQYLSTFAEVSFILWHIKNYSVKVSDAYF